jgi:glucosylceramidase
MSTANNVGVYPNPASNYVVIQTEQQIAGTAAVSLTDVTGRIILSTEVILNNNGQGEVDLSKVPAGLYILKVTSANFNYTGKLTKQD